MRKQIPQETISSLTDLQRLVLEAMRYGDALTVKELYNTFKQKISYKTIRRSLAMLVSLGVIERIPASRWGRGYSTIYKLKEG